MESHYYPEFGSAPHRLKLKGIGYLGHYASVLLALFPFLLSVVSYIEYLIGSYQGLRSIEELFIGTRIFPLIAFVLLLIQYNRLKFTAIETKKSNEKIMEICDEIAKVNSWKVKYRSNNRFVASSNSVLNLGFWGEMITVIITENKIYVNSICDPYKRPNLLSTRKDKLFKKALIKELRILHP